MKQVKSVELFSDVTCQNCVSYNHSRCCKSLPAIPTEADNRCGKGYWLFKGEIINYRHISMELQTVIFVTTVEDLVCKNCVFYDSHKEECHHYRENIYKSAPQCWCNHGTWLEDGSSAGSLSALYPKLATDKDKTKSSSINLRKVKTIEVFSDVKCENCFSFNQGRCYHSLPAIPVGPDDKCHEGEWLHKGQNLYGISISLLPGRLVKDIEDLRCRECIFYNSRKEECHFYRQNVHKSGPDDWCDDGKWLYEDKIIGTSRGSLEFLYPKFMEGKDEKIRSY